MKKTPLLVINTYGGSLLVGAQLAGGFDITASMEDGGYGSDIQAANFPKVPLVRARADWPSHGRRGLRGHLVIAHPPCAAFSRQTKGGANIRGLDATKFQCTVDVLGYALGAGCDALAIESVLGAVVGAAPVHEAAAAKYGYHLYRVLQNAATFGVPQQRERFWAVFVRRDLGVELMLTHAPRRVTVGEVVERKPGEADPRIAADLVELATNLRADPDRLLHGTREVEQLFAGVFGDGYLPSILNKLRRTRGLRVLDRAGLNKRYWRPGALFSHWPKILADGSLAHVVMGDSCYAYRGRALSHVEHNRLMGFPDGYVFPNPKKQREFLSRGVCPPVAAWILEQLDAHVNGRRLKRLPGAVEHTLTPGATVDLRPPRSWLKSAAVAA